MINNNRKLIIGIYATIDEKYLTVTLHNKIPFACIHYTPNENGLYSSANVQSGRILQFLQTDLTEASRLFRNLNLVLHTINHQAIMWLVGIDGACMINNIATLDATGHLLYLNDITAYSWIKKKVKDADCLGWRYVLHTPTAIVYKSSDLKFLDSDFINAIYEPNHTKGR